MSQPQPVPPQGGQPRADPPVFSLRGVRRTFGPASAPVRALREATFDVPAGQRLGVVGESGSGKSTLIKLMAALDRPTAGGIEFAGRSIVGVAERRLGFLRSEVQVVFQDPRSSLNPRMSVADIITEPLRSRLLRPRSDVPTDRAARLAEVLDEVGLPRDSGRRYPHEFSGGQRQRIAIARALAPRPSVLMADEPVSALDVSVRAQVLNVLVGLVNHHRLTLVFISHDLTVVRHVCDEMLVMRDGAVVEKGPAERVYTRPEADYTRQLLTAVPRLP